MIKKTIMSIILLLSMLLTGKKEYAAYQFTNYQLSNPLNVTYEISSMAGQYGSIIVPYTEIWEDYCPEIAFGSTSGEENIYFYAEPSYNNGTYAVTRFVSNERYIITFYNSFTNASSSMKNEVIVHEVGHALGLDHCEEEKNSISVMRAIGFNWKAYPLSDDIEGIAHKY